MFGELGRAFAKALRSFEDSLVGRIPWGRFRAWTVEDVPDSPAARVVYLVGQPDEYWLALVRCPCGCGEPISLPMTTGTDPCWHFNANMRRPSLTPSIWRTTGCKSHFFLRNGRVVWCR